MENKFLASEFDRIKKRDNRHIKILAAGYVLVTLFGFLALMLLLNSLQAKYEERFKQFEAKTEALSESTKEDIAELVKEIEIKDETYERIDESLKNADVNFKEEINKLWRSAYVKARNNEKMLKNLMVSMENNSQSLRELEESFAQVSNELSGTKSKFETSIADNSSLLESFRENLSEIKNKIVSIHSSIEETKAYINNPGSQWNINRNRLNDLSHNLKAMEVRVTALENDFNSNANEIESAMQHQNQNVESLSLPSSQSVESNNQIQPIANASAD